MLWEVDPAAPSPHGTELSDAELVAGARAGDRVLGRAFIERHRRSVGALVRRMLAPSGLDDLTEDLAQETFVRAFAALSRFDPHGPARLRTWILTIATRLALHELERRRLPRQPLHERDAEAGPGSFADAASERARLGRAIERAVGRLAPDHRAAFLLREYHGLDYAEIAEALGVDLGTVKSRLHRARQALRRDLEEYAP
jgi:RNA polymerase sigma-70 factor, ECF subfamily